MFSKSALRKVKKGKFDLSHEVKFTCEMGQLIPILCQEIVPGDKFKGSAQALVRLLPQIAPVMHNVDVFTRFFFCPNRLIWKNWENFITGGKDNSDNSVAPYIEVQNAPIRSVFDYMGVPTEVANKLKVSALPFRAMNLIYNNYFIDQNLQEELPVNIEDGLDETEYSLLNVNWEKDYFTSCLANPQAGSGVSMPLSESAPVIGNGMALGLTDGIKNAGMYVDPSATNILNADVNLYGSSVGVDSSSTSQFNTRNSVGVVGDASKSGLIADLSDSTPVSIETLRNAFKVQGFLERLNRGGWKYIDWLKSFFGVKASDARLQLPEYLGGSRTPLMFSEVLQTSSTDGVSPQGNMSGRAVSAMQSKPYNRYFEEHGWLMGFFYIKPRTQYSQGLSRKFTRETKFDYLIPDFQNLGEQAVLNKELYAQGTSADDEAFGHQPRYQEYRSNENRVCGDFKKTLKYWTMAREFANAPQLNSEFVTCNPTTRIYATEQVDENHCLVDLVNFIYAKRPLMKYVTPASLN